MPFGCEWLEPDKESSEQLVRSVPNSGSGEKHVTSTVMFTGCRTTPFLVQALPFSCQHTKVINSVETVVKRMWFVFILVRLCNDVGQLSRS